MKHFSGQFARVRRAGLMALLLAAGASCGEAPTAVATDRRPDLQLPPVDGAASATLLQCDADPASRSVTGVVDALGGTLQIGNTRVVIPANAVLAPTAFEMTIPSSRFVEISVKAGDAQHYLFELPVMVSIDYGRCADSLSPLRPLSVWHIDEESRSLLENMSGVDLRPFHTITFFTGHLSGYAVAD